MSTKKSTTKHKTVTIKNMDYILPKFKAQTFTCPWCLAICHFSWEQLQAQKQFRPIYETICSHCKKSLYFLGSEKRINEFQVEREGIQIYPPIVSGPPPHKDLPNPCKIDFLEARQIAHDSPRGAAALLRLVLQKLIKTLSGKGMDINEGISTLAKKGLPSRIQKSLDILRVIGNNAVHPGEMNIKDNPKKVLDLFEIVNLIVENRIAEPKKINKIYNTLPKKNRDSIKKRDKIIKLNS